MTDANDPREQAEQELLVARAEALFAYANVEQALCMMLAFLTKTSIRAASIIFYRAGSHSRNVILEELMALKKPPHYDAYWSSIIMMVRGLDSARNNIAHWHGYVEVSDDGISVGLSRPATWFSGKEITKMTTAEIREFSAKCDFVASSLNMFNAFLEGHLDQNSDPRTAWRDIFQQPAVYPPPDTHPLSPNYKEPETPPRS